jgi:hypothetical protein
MLDDYNTKSAAGSLGVWGSLIAALGGGVVVGGVLITPDDINEALQLIAALASAIGGLLSLWGRLRATRRIDRVI